jgi:hypothetical protein
VLVTGISERDINPSHNPKAPALELVSAWLKEKFVASARLATRFPIASLKPVHQSVSFGWHMREEVHG